MQPEKNNSTADSNSIDDESMNTDVRSCRPSTEAEYLSSASQERRQSHCSSQSESLNRGSISCVSQESMSADDCARQRFIVWAAVRRNRSVRMAVNERLRCPLLRCGEQFSEHEEMLRHLTECKHLSTGEYVCYECMKVERFNDKKCRCCLGQPTKRKRIMNMAKNFFTNIGSASARVRRGETISPSRELDYCHPPSYDSLGVDMHALHEESGIGHVDLREEGGREVEQPELCGTELIELDSGALISAELDGDSLRPNTSTAPEFPTTTNNAALPDTHSLVQKPPEHPTRFQAPPPPQSGSSGNGGRRPSLALDTQVDCYRTKTRTAYLSPSSSLQSRSQGISPITPWSSSSKTSAAWSAAPRQDDFLASPITPLSANLNSTVPSQDRVFGLLGMGKDTDEHAYPKDPCQYIPGNVLDGPEDSQLPFPISQLPLEPLGPYDSKDDYSWLSSMDTLGTSINMMFTDPTPKTIIPQDLLEPQFSGSETRALVEQVWETLGTHFSTSLSKLSRISNNPLADRLREQTPRTVAAAGFARLRAILNPSNSSRPNPLEYLCFIHLVYSISVVMHHGDIIAQSSKLYDQAMAYGTRFDAAYRDNYYEVTAAIWQQTPQELPHQKRAREPRNRAAGNKGKEADYSHATSIATTKNDLLKTISQVFLDELENMVINSPIPHPIEVVTSQLWSSHFPPNATNLQAVTPLAAASGFLIHDLVRRYHDFEGLSQKLKQIGRRAHADFYPTVRKLELELIQVGKSFFTLDDYLEQYVPYVNELCSAIYSQQGVRKREEYYFLDITLVESLVAREPPQQHHTGYSVYAPSFPSIPYPYVDDFWNYTESPGHQPVNGVAGFNGALGPTSFIPASPRQISGGTPTHHTSETPSSEYTVSSAHLSEVPEVPISRSFGSRSPAQPRPEASSTSVPSTLPSSGQKVQANERCEICGYRPKGDPQWFKGSMAKHRKMQHSTNPPVIYKCPFPGCNSEYKNRRDNLRQHQIEKNHFVGDEVAPRPRKRRREPAERTEHT